MQGRRVVRRSADSETSLLLYSALVGSMDAVEWFLSDALLRRYIEFGKSEAATKDTGVQYLKKSPGGFDTAVARWLGSHHDLVIHAAIMGCRRNPRAGQVVESLIESCPASLSAESDAGLTPLAVAYWAV